MWFCFWINVQVTVRRLASSWKVKFPYTRLSEYFLENESSGTESCARYNEAQSCQKSPVGGESRQNVQCRLYETFSENSPNSTICFTIQEIALQMGPRRIFWMAETRSLFWVHTSVYGHSCTAMNSKVFCQHMQQTYFNSFGLSGPKEAQLTFSSQNRSDRGSRICGMWCRHRNQACTSRLCSIWDRRPGARKVWRTAGLHSKFQWRCRRLYCFLQERQRFDPFSAVLLYQFLFPSGRLHTDLLIPFPWSRAFLLFCKRWLVEAAGPAVLVPSKHYQCLWSRFGLPTLFWPYLGWCLSMSLPGCCMPVLVLYMVLDMHAWFLDVLHT